MNENRQMTYRELIDAAKAMNKHIREEREKNHERLLQGTSIENRAGTTEGNGTAQGD